MVASSTAFLCCCADSRLPSPLLLGRYLPIWHANPHRFLLESARVDPPVTSVTAVLPDQRTFGVASGWLGTGAKSITVPPGTTAQLAISSANRDPAVFGGAARSVRRAREFDPLGRSDEELSKILSWNGVQGAVEAGTAPRGCPGYVDCPLV